MKKLPYAETINYWKTSKSSPDEWIRRTCGVIEKHNGRIKIHAFGKDNEGNEAFMIQFILADTEFKAIWPILPTKYKEDKLAARRQAATLLYHDIKAKCLESTVKGAKVAFFEYLLLPDGRTAPEATLPELLQGIPLEISQYKIHDQIEFKEKHNG